MSTRPRPSHDLGNNRFATSQAVIQDLQARAALLKPRAPSLSRHKASSPGPLPSPPYTLRTIAPPTLCLSAPYLLKPAFIESTGSEAQDRPAPAPPAQPRLPRRCTTHLHTYIHTSCRTAVIVSRWHVRFLFVVLE